MIVDITDADLSAFKDKIVVDKSPVIDITPSQVENIARLEIALSQSVDTRVYASEGKLIVELAKPVEAAQPAPEPRRSRRPRRRKRQHLLRPRRQRSCSRSRRQAPKRAHGW